jgi:hypothetical protein
MLGHCPLRGLEEIAAALTSLIAAGLRLRHRSPPSSVIGRISRYWSNPLLFVEKSPKLEHSETSHAIL